MLASGSGGDSATLKERSLAARTVASLPEVAADENDLVPWMVLGAAPARLARDR